MLEACAAQHCTGSRAAVPSRLADLQVAPISMLSLLHDSGMHGLEARQMLTMACLCCSLQTPLGHLLAHQQSPVSTCMQRPHPPHARQQSLDAAKRPAQPQEQCHEHSRITSHQPRPTKAVLGCEACISRGAHGLQYACGLSGAKHQAPRGVRRAPRRRWEPSGLAVIRRKHAQCSGMARRRSVRPSLPSIRTCRRSSRTALPPVLKLLRGWLSVHPLRYRSATTNCTLQEDRQVLSSHTMRGRYLGIGWMLAGGKHVDLIHHLRNVRAKGAEHQGEVPLLQTMRCPPRSR